MTLKRYKVLDALKIVATEESDKYAYAPFTILNIESIYNIDVCEDTYCCLLSYIKENKEDFIILPDKLAHKLEHINYLTEDAYGILPNRDVTSVIDDVKKLLQDALLDSKRNLSFTIKKTTNET